MPRYVVHYTSMVVEADNADEAISRAMDSSGGHWEATERFECRHCQRPIELRDGSWASPDADHSDDSEWLCEEHDTFAADHEPVEDAVQTNVLSS